MDGWNRAEHAVESSNIVDRWLQSRAELVCRSTSIWMHKLYVVVPEIVRFIDDLTNIYIRLNRQRFWGEGLPTDKRAAYTSLFDALHTLCACMAPFAPFITEHLYQELKAFCAVDYLAESIHFVVTQHHTRFKIDQTLEQGVALMVAVILLGRQKRNDSKIKIKIPLKSLCIVHRDAAVLEAIKPLESYLRAELNVKAYYSTDEAH